MYIVDLIVTLEHMWDIGNHTADSTFTCQGITVPEVKEKAETVISKMLDWFKVKSGIVNNKMLDWFKVKAGIVNNIMLAGLSQSHKVNDDSGWR